MNKVITALLVTAFLAAAAQAGIYSLYGDKKAKKIDDIITILIIEDAQANNKTLTDSKSGSDVGLTTGASGGGLMSFLPQWSFSGKNNADFQGRGETSRSGVLKAKVTARIVEVHDNGNLLIQGSKLVAVNNEKEMIHVSGIIRPEDIRADNTIFSYSIADAKITYTGDGTLNDTQKPGIVTRFFTWLF
ncbi:MAG: flagellar basal body L-ring protein FlgH [Fibrobacterota bacterium]